MKVDARFTPLRYFSFKLVFLLFSDILEISIIKDEYKYPFSHKHFFIYLIEIIARKYSHKENIIIFIYLINDT